MTLSETVIVAAGLGLLLLVVALGVATVRNELKTRQVWEVLATLNRALSAYHQATGRWPTGEEQEGERGREGESGSGGDGDGAAERVIAALAAEAASADLLGAIPEVLWVGSRDEGSSTGDGSVPALRDAWGRRLRCLTSASRSAVDRQAVAGNGGRPIFISAGIDGKFGRQGDVADADDNLRSDELPRTMDNE